MCTEEELYRKKTKTKACGHASRERDINNTKLHTLSGNAWSCSLFFLSFQTKRAMEKGGGGASLPGRSSGNLHQSALWKWRRWSRWCSGRSRSRCFLRTEPAPSICRHAWTAVKKAAQTGHVRKHHCMFPDGTQFRTPRGCKHGYKGNKWRNK